MVKFVSITVTVVVLTGFVGAVIGPLLIKIFGKKDDIAIGLALGSSSHAIGTSKTFDYSEKPEQSLQYQSSLTVY